MNRILLLLFLLLSGALVAQTTYTTTQDACSGKSSQYCSLPVSETPSNGITTIVIDSRGSYPGATMYIGGWGIDPVHGTLAGFVANPDGTHHPYYGAGSFDSTDELVTGSFQFYAYYVSICSGRGCGGTLGWHYRMLSGSTIEDAR